MSRAFDISVIVPTCPERIGKLGSLLSSIAETESDRDRFEVIVVVDGEDERPIRMCRELGDGIAYQAFTQRHRGPSAARNLAISKAQGQWLLFLDDDALVDRQTIPGHLRCIRQSGGKPRAFLGRMDWTDRLLVSPWNHLLSGTSMLFFWDKMRPSETYGFRHFWTFNVSVPTEMVREVGGFSESFPLAMHEDIELGWRLEKRFGIRIQPVPEIRSWHEHPRTPRQYFEREYVSGEVARIAKTVDREFHDAVWGRMGDIEQLHESLVRMFTGPSAEIRELLERWSRPSGHELSTDEMRSVYLAHLPLKRMVFCQGYLGRMFDDCSSGCSGEAESREKTMAASSLVTGGAD